MHELTGGCLCGSVRYRVSGESVATRICWCRDCQRISGNGTANVVFPTAALHIDGQLGEHVKMADSGHGVRRKFCPRCGSHLFADNTGRPELSVVRVGTLDDPSAIVPTANIWASSAPEWACLDGQLERVEKQPRSLRPAPRAE
jgi:hypothetical protein